jgi:hypothetical protein
LGGKSLSRELRDAVDLYLDVPETKEAVPPGRRTFPARWQSQKDKKKTS